MVSKLTKFAAVFGLLGALSFGLNAQADGDYMQARKKPCHKKMVECEHKPMMVEPCYEQPAMPMTKANLGPAMTLAIGGDFGFAINGNSDFSVGAIPQGQGNPQIPPAATLPFTFSQKRDSMYGGFVALGWMMNNGLEADIEVAYHQLKNKDKNNSLNSLESDIFSGMINLQYFLDLFSGNFMPYVSVGGGIARTQAKGTLYDSVNIANANVITVKDLTKTTFAYQASIGASTSIDQLIVGAAYKFFGVASFSDSNSDITVNVVNAAGAGGALIPPTPFSFGSIKNNTHNFTIFVKFLF